ncbi:GMC oxidoreductase [Pseudarthrobacter cellobiosi]|uniref:GMC oxidoreductase n=1 Tax=Pseudarthrobacter cellobiosi TaxID=2953654 RepID=UPI00208FD060|nr:GMC family oxidoreductase [Pseudarthrobacter sp. HLT1-5]MCO4257017.1 GMC family oxidoreductase [Pseudarthrobacter sp. HLT1-5]
MNARDAGPAVDHDVVVIGSGFGGSVAALRLAEKGYDVHVLEAGRRFEDGDFAKTSWNLRKYLWAPKFGCFGVQRIHRLPDALILAGAGVGGGSLNYANTLYIPPAPFFQDRQWGHITDWQDELAPHYRMGQSMLGVVTNPCEGPVEQLMRAAADELGVGPTFKKAPTGVFFGMPGVRVPDPYFGGAGPERTGCTECGNCMVGCRVGAKNTLTKNYLGLAEKIGVRVTPLRTVVEVRPLTDAEAPAYEIVTECTGSWTKRGKGRQVLTARHVVFAAGTWGTQSLLHEMRDGGQLPGLSDSLGVLTRTNSEALLGAMTSHRPPKGMDLTKGVAITASFHPAEDTHIENVRYGKGSNAMGALSTLAVPGDGRLPRWVRFIGVALKNPLAIPSIEPTPWKFSERTIIGLVMQTRDNSLTVSGKRRLFGGRKLTSRQGHGEPNPTYIEPGHRAMGVIARLLQERGGRRTYAGATLGEIFDVPLTAHFLGGACISDSPESGVIDPYHRVWGYPGMHIVDGAAISANLGVNPSLSITAQAERAFSLWPNKGEADARPAPGEAYVRMEPVAALRPAVTTFTHQSARV